MIEAVLDASVILAHLKGEPGGDLALSLIPSGQICSINLSEVVAKLIDNGDSAQLAIATVASLQVLVFPADVELALDAGAMRAGTRHLGLSLGDRFCLALGRRTGLPVYTADRRWAALAGSMDIRLIR